MTRGRPFEPGNNVGRGRPKGSKNKSTSVGQRLLEQHEEALMAKNISESLKTNTRSRLWCLEKLLQGARPGRKLKLPPIKTLEDINTAHNLILNAVANQNYSLNNAQALFVMIAEMRKTIDAQDLARLEKVEAAVKKILGGQ